MARRRSAATVLRLFNPFSRLDTAPTLNQRIEAAAGIVAGDGDDLPPAGAGWFGWLPSDAAGGRYMLVGFVAGEGALGDGRGYLVDVVSGHVLWRSRLHRRSDLPRSMSAITSARPGSGAPPVH